MVGNVLLRVALRSNVDGSSKGNPGPAGFGGLLRNDEGGLILRFQGCIGVAGILLVEIKAIEHGLRLAWSRCFKNVICESDSLEAVRLINEGMEELHLYGSTIMNVRQMLSWNWDARVVHVLREANFCSDLLAKRGADGVTTLNVLDNPPVELSTFLLADALETLL